MIAKVPPVQWVAISTYTNVLLEMPSATVTILHARRTGIDATTGPMYHVGHVNLIEFRIYRRIRHFCTDDIIYCIQDNPICSADSHNNKINDCVVNHALAIQSSLWFTKDHF